MDLVSILPVLLALSTVSQQVTLNFVKPFLSGALLKFAAVVVAVGVTYGVNVLGLSPKLSEASDLQVVVCGVFVGMGSNILHGLIEAFAPPVNKTPLLSFKR